MSSQVEDEQQHSFQELKNKWAQQATKQSPPVIEQPKPVAHAPPPIPPKPSPDSLLKAHDEEEKRVSTLAQQFEKQQISTSANGNFSTQTDKPVLRNIQQHSPPPKEPAQNSIVKPTMAQPVTTDEEHYSDIDDNDDDSDEEDSSEDDQDAIVDQDIDNSLVEQVQKTHLQYTKLEESRFAENLAPGVRKQHGRPAPPPPAKKIPKRQPPPPPPPSQKYHNTARTQVLEANIPSPPNTTQAVIPNTSTINTAISTGPPSMPSSPPTLPPPNLPPRPSQAVQITPIPQLPPRPSLSTLAKAHTIASGMMKSGNSNVIGRPLHASPPPMSHLSSNEDLHRSNTTSALSKNALLKAAEGPKDTPVCPDFTQASRNPPLYNHEKKVILTGHKGSLFALAACRDMIFTGSHLLRTWDINSGTVLNTIGDANPNQTNEHEKVHAITVAPCGNPIEEGRYVWVAKQDTGIYIVDTRANPPIYGKKMEGHSSPVSFLLRFRNSEIWSIDESGILNVWEIDDASPLRPPLPKKVQVSRNAIAATIANSLLWMSSGRTVAVHSVLSPNDPPIPTIRLPNDLGNITALITIPYHQDCVFASHEYGKISKWEAKDGKSVKKLQVITVSMYGICTMISVGEHYVWAGYNTGMIYIYDTRPENWAVVKSWKAHAGAVNHLVVDDSGLILGEMSGRMQVVSGDSNGSVSIWDGLLTEHWREHHFLKRESEYCTYEDNNLMICSWNIDANKPEKLVEDDETIREWLGGMQDPDIIVVGIQEIIDLESKKQTARTLFSSRKKGETADLEEGLTRRYRLWHDYLVRIIGDNYGHDKYTVVKTDQMVGLFSCIFVRTVDKPRIFNVDSTLVKTGLKVMNKSIHGNKGGIAIRMVYNHSSLCFVNCHLAAGQSHFQQRNSDAEGILHNASFPDNGEYQDVFSHGGDGTMIMDHEFCFLSGDLNYRVDMTRNTVLQKLSQPDKKRAWKELQEKDQLLRQHITNPLFKLLMFNEAPIRFDPTYKYDPGTDYYDRSEKKRVPAWCDRVLFKGKNIESLYYTRYEVRASDHRPIASGLRFKTKLIDDDRRNMLDVKIHHEWEDHLGRFIQDKKARYLADYERCSLKEAFALLENSNWKILDAVTKLPKRKNGNIF